MADAGGETGSSPGPRLLRTEDYWAIWLGLGIIALAMLIFVAGGSLRDLAVLPGRWAAPSELFSDLAARAPAYVALFVGFGAAFGVSIALMGRALREYVAGYVVLFLGSLVVFYLAASTWAKQADLGPPLLALVAGLAVGNLRKLPAWLRAALRTEYYIKTGIVLLGATLPLTLIYTAGPAAFVQATIVSVTTWLTIYLAATRLFGLDPRFGAVLGTGGAVCGVSGSIAVGGAIRADKDHIAIGIAVVSIWAVVMILVLTAATKMLVPGVISPGVAGAWVGTSEYADAAGFAVVAELARTFGDAPIHAFTLMKVIGRDIWIGIWAFVLSIVSVVYWERHSGSGRVSAGVIWDRFPKFVLGFLAASVVMSLAAAMSPSVHEGRAPWAGTYRTEASAEPYDADFTSYEAPEALAGRFVVDHGTRQILFRGAMGRADFDALARLASTDDQRAALKELRFRADWYESVLKPRVVGPIKNLREWCFVLCFLSIGLSTRFRELATFGMKPFWAFTIGVLVNVPLGYALSTMIFRSFWMALD